MTKLNKIFAVLTAFIILVSSFCLITASATNVNYSVSSASGKKGDTVTVTVKVSSSIGVTSALLDVNYDNTKLQYVSSTAGSMFTTCTIKENGNSSVKCTGMTLGDDSAKKSGTFATLKFKILADSGTASLTIVPSSSSGDHSGVGTPPTKLSPSVTNGKITVTTPVTSIKLNKSSVTLNKGETSQLTATISPDNATSKTVTYTTSNSKVAKVSSSGKITAVGGGTATITAKAGGKTATCKVTVNVTQTGITHSGSSSKTVEQGDTTKLSITKVPADSTDNYSVTWSSADATIATVSANGTVKGVAVGETTVTAKSNGWSVTYNIKVVEKVTESSTEESTNEIPTEDSTEPIESTTESTTAPIVTEPEETTQDFFEAIKNEINDPENKVTSARYYITMLVVAVATGVIVIPVTFLVTSGYYKTKIKKQNKDEE